MVFRQVEEHAHVGHQLVGPVELETGELRHQHVDALRGGDGLGHAHPNIADRLRLVASVLHDAGQHGGGGGFPIGAGDDHPGAGRPEHRGPIQPVAEFHVAEHFQADRLGRPQQGCVGPPPG